MHILFTSLFNIIGTDTESGLVVIYSRKTNLDNLAEDGRLIGSRQARARFGSAIMIVGDLDRDGYNGEDWRVQKVC